MGLSSKYGRVTVEREGKVPIQEDEPVFLIRARDRCAAQMVMIYAHANGGPIVDRALAAREEILEWQAKNPDLVKTAD